MPLPDYEFYTASYLGEKIPQESFEIGRASCRERV